MRLARHTATLDGSTPGPADRIDRIQTFTSVRAHTPYASPIVASIPVFRNEL